MYDPVMAKAKLGALVSLGIAAMAGACGGSSSTGGGGSAATTTTGPGTGGATSTTTSTGTGGGGPMGVTKVFLILMENHNWGDIKGSSSAPYINGLLAKGAHAEQYFNPPSNHPSEPNYLWLEAGTNFGISDDSDPSSNHQSTKAHLVTQLETAGHTWKAYQEDIDGATCPLTSVNNYAPKHCAMVFFDDVTNTNDAMSAHCIAHVRPYTELAGDLTNDTVPDYSFITPNLCDDMHDSCAPTNDSVKQGDTWLSTEVPKILASKAYQDGAAVIITWDESELGEFPIGLIVLANSAKVGYSNSTHYTHSATLRTMQEIFGVSPFLRDAANGPDLSDLFMP
jgi:hypothetical protein